MYHRMMIETVHGIEALKPIIDKIQKDIGRAILLGYSPSVVDTMRKGATNFTSRDQRGFWLDSPRESLRAFPYDEYAGTDTAVLNALKRDDEKVGSHVEDQVDGGTLVVLMASNPEATLDPDRKGFVAVLDSEPFRPINPNADKPRSYIYDGPDDLKVLAGATVTARDILRPVFVTPNPAFAMYEGPLPEDFLSTTA